MKPLIRLLLLCLLLSSRLYAQTKILYYQPAPANGYSPAVLKADLAADVDTWMQIMEQSHVDLYHAISKEDLALQAKQLLSALPDTVQRAEAVFTISRLAALLNEGHIGLATDPYLDSLYRWTAIRFPYMIQEINESGMVVDYDLSKRPAKLPRGANILSVNGVQAPGLYKRYSAFFGGLPEWRKVSVKDAIRKLLFLDDSKSPFTIVAKTGADTVQFNVEGFSRTDADSISRALAQQMVQPQPFELKFLPDNIALIAFNDMDGEYRERFAAFLDTSFSVIAAKKAKGLIIDLRRNGGGDSGLGEMLISYFTGKRYRNVSAVKLKISKHGRELAKLYGQPYSLEAMPDGSVYTHNVKRLTRPQRRVHRFRGKTAVLIGPGTFSSANMLANTIKDYKLARVFGQPTAEPGNDFGEVFSFMLPRTNIIARGATKMFVRANGDDKDFNGIQPDVLVEDEERVVEEARNWILKK